MGVVDRAFLEGGESEFYHIDLYLLCCSFYYLLLKLILVIFTIDYQISFNCVISFYYRLDSVTSTISLTKSLAFRLRMK